MFFYVEQTIDWPDNENIIIYPSDERRKYIIDLQYGLNPYFIPIIYPERLIKYNFIVSNLSGDEPGYFMFEFVVYEFEDPPGFYTYTLFFDRYFEANEVNQFIGEFPFYLKISKASSSEPDRYYFFRLVSNRITNITGVISIERI